MKRLVRTLFVVLALAAIPNLLSAQLVGQKTVNGPQDQLEGTESVQSKQMSQETLNVWPNPTMDRVTVKLSDFEGVNILQLLDFSGEVVYEQPFQNRNEYVFILNEFGDGTYVIRVVNAQGMRTATVLNY